METLATFVMAPFEASPAWLNLVFSLVTAASAITAVTPTPHDDALLGRLYRLVELFALNIGHAKEKGRFD